MRILSIDQSYTSCGIVVFDDTEIIHVDRFVTKGKDKDMFQRAVIIAEEIVKVAKEFSPDLVALEGLAFGMRGSATRDLAGLQFIIVAWLREINNFDVDIIAPLTVKKFATGNGRSKKEELYECLPQKTKDFLVEEKGYKKSKGLFDLVDAYWIGRTAHDKKVEGK